MWCAAAHSHITICYRTRTNCNLPPADEQLDAAYEEVASVVSIGRGVGAWGDMVVTLKDGSKIEMRSLPR